MLLASGLTTDGWAQAMGERPDWTKKIEQARFEIHKKGAAGSYTDITFLANPLDYKQFILISEAMYEKEGIFNVELIKDNYTLRVYHLNYIENITIKEFIFPYRTNFNPEEPAPFDPL
jgi:hypothetical protein